MGATEPVVGPQARGTRLPRGSRFLLIVGSLALSCSHGDEDPSLPGGPATEFMAGDTLVRLVGRPLHPGTAELTLELTIGMFDGPPEYTLSGVSEVLPLPDGSVLIHDGGYGSEPSLRHYDDQGGFLGCLGRTGSGPGEFRQPTGLTRLPDGRILFGDTRAGRINVYASDGEVLEGWNLGSSHGTIGNSRRRLVSDTAGTVYLYFVDLSVRDRRSDDRYKFLRLQSDGTILDTIPLPELPEFPNDGSVRKIRQLESGGTSIRGWSVPYFPRYTWALSPLGCFLTGRTDRYAIDLRIPESTSQGLDAGPPIWSEGQRVVSIRRDVEPVPVEEQERRGQMNYVQARADRVEGRLEAPIPPVPEHKPIFRWIQVGQEGRIWVQLHTPSVRQSPEQEASPEEGDQPSNRWREPTIFDVFDPQGIFLGQVAVPEGVWVLATLGDTVWAVTYDEFDIPYVQRYRIDW